MIRAYLKEEEGNVSDHRGSLSKEQDLSHFLEASRESSSDLAPVTTIFPDAKMRAVVLGSRIRMMTAANR